MMSALIEARVLSCRTTNLLMFLSKIFLVYVEMSQGRVTLGGGWKSPCWPKPGSCTVLSVSCILCAWTSWSFGTGFVAHWKTKKIPWKN